MSTADPHPFTWTGFTAEPAERFRIWFYSLRPDLRRRVAEILEPLAAAMRTTMVDIETGERLDQLDIHGPDTPDLSTVNLPEIEEQFLALAPPCSEQVIEDIWHIVDFLTQVDDSPPEERYMAIGGAHSFVAVVESGTGHYSSKVGS